MSSTLFLQKKNNYFIQLRTFEDQAEWIHKNLNKDNSYIFSTLPFNIQRQLLIDRDPHGNVQVSRIETEKLLIEMVSDYVKEQEPELSFNTQHHFFGYEGRCAFPSNFDVNYTYSLGYTAFLLIANNATGYLSCIKNLCSPVSEWKAYGIPLTMMMNMEERHGIKKPVIKKALVNLHGKPFQYFAAHRNTWARENTFFITRRYSVFWTR